MKDNWKERKFDNLLAKLAQKEARIQALEGVVENVKGCLYYLDPDGCCKGCNKRGYHHKHDEWCSVGRLKKTLKKLEEV